MKICVWRTRHEIANTVANAVNDGLSSHGLYLDLDTDESLPIEADIHIGYGILRGMDEVFHACDKAGKPWINIDKGYWKPGHYDGYYRISLMGTQQTTGLDKLQPDYERLNRLGIEIMKPRNVIGPPLVCNPTAHVEAFFGMQEQDWLISQCYENTDLSNIYIYRPKDCKRPLEEDMTRCSKLITFNSSVGWEALRQGIPVVSDPIHSIVGAYQKLVDKPLHLDVEARRKLFAIQAGLQLTLSEMRSGLLWPLVQRLIESTSVTTTANQ